MTSLRLLTFGAAALVAGAVAVVAWSSWRTEADIAVERHAKLTPILG